MKFISSDAPQYFRGAQRNNAAKPNTRRRGLLLEHSSSKMIPGTSNANIKHRFKVKRKLYENPWGLLEYIEPSYQLLCRFCLLTRLHQICLPSSHLVQSQRIKAAYAGISPSSLT